MMFTQRSILNRDSPDVDKNKASLPEWSPIQFPTPVFGV